MTAAAFDASTLLPFLPESGVGVVERIEPIRLGLSGAGMYAVTTSRGAFVLRVARRTVAGRELADYLVVLRRAADAGIAPAIVHVDEVEGVLVTERVNGSPLAAALVDPTQRSTAMASMVDRMRTLHSLDTTGVATRNPIAYTRACWQTAKGRDGYPPWATELAPTLAHIEAMLARDPRRVVSHNDVHPTNVIWDGTRVWLIDWEVAGLSHPHYDLASLAMFLRLDDGAALELCAAHDGARLDERARETFHALRKLVGLVCGLTFLGLVEDLTIRPAETLADAPALADVFQSLRAGTLDVQSARGRIDIGLALLATAIATG